MKKKFIIISSIIVTLLIIVIGGYFLISKDKEYKYTVEEEKWIEDNKNNVIDIYMPSDIASLTLSGEGLFFDFINYLTESINIKINPVAYNIGSEVNSEYSILLVDKVEENDIEILNDEYVLISKNKNMYSSKSEFNGLKIGVLTGEKDIISQYLGQDIVYVNYDTKDLLLSALKSDQVSGIIGLKTIYLNDILTNKYHINYHISDLNKSYVLRSNSEDKLENSIIKKELLKFVKDKYQSAYNKGLLNSYVKAYELTEKDLTELNSKTYTYGYIENGMYDNTLKKSLSGTNYFIVKSFASYANIDMKYDDEYNSLDDLNNGLTNKKIDFYFDNSKFNLDSSNLLAVNSKIVFLTKNNSKIKINSLVALTKYEVSVLKNSKLEQFLQDNNIKSKSFTNYDEMLSSKNLTNNSIIALELDNYEYYKLRNLSNFHIEYIADEKIKYGFMVNSDNKIFSQLFDFYLEYIDVNALANRESVSTYEYEGINIFLLVVVIILLGIFILQFIGKIKRAIKVCLKKKDNTLNRAEKLKYIDNLTSLKNRAYLNDNIEKWDNSEIYPQILIVVDLNNIVYINDNFGHEEGDKVITEAANILIQSQLPNTEIIRTDGNEFLIYMVEYEEKKAVSYIRKLKRELKNISHGYGAAIGYSIINDAIKTIDDAVNEATLDMRANKELMSEEEK